MKRAPLPGRSCVCGLSFDQGNRPGGCRLEGHQKGNSAVLLEKEHSTALLQEEAPPVNGVVCGQPVESHGITQAPAHLVIRWRGGGAPTVQPFIGHDVTFAFVMAEGMMGIRDGDTVTLYAVHWSACLWGRA